MVYNNGFPMNYQYLQAQPQYGFQPAYVQQPYVQQPVQQQVPSSTANQSMTNITWVQGEAGARAFSVPNGETYALWDSDEQLIYLKSVDQSGKPTMITLEYVNKADIVDEPAAPQYVTQEQFEQLNKQFEALQEKLNSLKPQQQNNNRNKGGRNNG